MQTIINTEFPEFKLQAYQGGKFNTVSNADIRGKWAVFFFYPADFTFVCPTELGELADKYAELKEMGVEVFSVSTDTHFTHKAWHDSSPTIKKIQFGMLADPTCQLTRALGALEESEGLAYRATYLVDPKGKVKIADIQDNAVGRNADELVRRVQAAQFVDNNAGQVCPANWRPGKDTLKPSAELVGKI